MNRNTQSSLQQRVQRSFVCAVLVGLNMLLLGCARSMVAESAVDTWGGTDAELDFWQAMETQRIVSNNDALHGLFLLVDGNDPATTYEERLTAAHARGWLAGSPPANESACMGTFAMAACEFLEIRGGLTMSIFGASPRYATRELSYLRLTPVRTENQAVSGPEFLDLVGRLQDEAARRQALAKETTPESESES